MEKPGAGRGFRVDCRRCSALLAVLLVASGCAALGPRFDQAVTTSFARQPMRKLETPRVELYYPEANRDEALRIARRLDWCVELLRKNRLSSTPRPKVLAYLTTADFDNAYVQPQLGGLPLQMVLAQHFTTEGFNLLEIGTNHVDDVSCHEAVHYVQFAEVEELWYYLNLAFGDLLDPNIATEAYFLEGLATYYEGRLDRATGRPHSPIWQGLFDSGVALRKGDIYPGDMSPGQRQLLPFGGQYVVGSQFITWLARRYGAEKLWELIDVQGSSWIPFLGVSFRFMWVYGKDPGGLVAEWRETLQHSGPWRERPEGQKVLDRDLGYFARIASAPDGTLATITAGLDFASELRIRNPDGSLRFRRAAHQLPARPALHRHQPQRGQRALLRRPRRPALRRHGRHRHRRGHGSETPRARRARRTAAPDLGPAGLSRRRRGSGRHPVRLRAEPRRHRGSVGARPRHRRAARTDPQPGPSHPRRARPRRRRTHRLLPQARRRLRPLDPSPRRHRATADSRREVQLLAALGRPGSGHRAARGGRAHPGGAHRRVDRGHHRALRCTLRRAGSGSPARKPARLRQPRRLELDAGLDGHRPGARPPARAHPGAARSERAGGARGPHPLRRPVPRDRQPPHPHAARSRSSPSESARSTTGARTPCTPASRSRAATASACTTTR